VELWSNRDVDERLPDYTASHLKQQPAEVSAFTYSVWTESSAIRNGDGWGRHSPLYRPFRNGSYDPSGNRTTRDMVLGHRGALLLLLASQKQLVRLIIGLPDVTRRAACYVTALAKVTLPDCLSLWLDLDRAPVRAAADGICYGNAPPFVGTSCSPHNVQPCEVHL
jgi:hypothetical protein